MSKNIFESELVNITELNVCPVTLTVHSLKKIKHLERIIKSSSDLLPALEIAVLPNNKKYVVKEYAVFEALRRIGKNTTKAKFHFVKNLTEVITLHFRLSQTDPLNPLAILDMRDYLMTMGFSIDQIADICVMEPTYVNLLKCDLTSKARYKLSVLLDMLSTKISRVEMPVYVIEIISKRPQEIQDEIVDRIHQYINDEKMLTDKEFTFPNQMQIKLYAELCKKSEKRNGIIFKNEEVLEVAAKRKKVDHSQNNTLRPDEVNNIVGNIPHMALLELEGKKIRIDWKTKTFSKINEQKNGFVVIQDSCQLKRMLALSEEQIKFLGLTEDEYPSYNKITSSEQLKEIADKVKNKPFKAILIFNKL